MKSITAEESFEETLVVVTVVVVVLIILFTVVVVCIICKACPGQSDGKNYRLTSAMASMTSTMADLVDYYNLRYSNIANRNEPRGVPGDRPDAPMEIEGSLNTEEEILQIRQREEAEAEAEAEDRCFYSGPTKV